jgi:hypothetical protein
MHSLPHIDFAHVPECDPQRSLDVRVANKAAVTNAPQALGSLPRDPSIDDLDDATSTDNARVEIGRLLEALSARELHDRQRRRGLASLFAVAANPKATRRRQAKPPAATRR